jgi:DnaJ homolog subfamily B member 4
MSDYYEILNVPKNVSSIELKQSYRNLARKWHPDKWDGEKDKKVAESKFKLISQAYEILSDPEKKVQYDFQTSMNNNQNCFNYNDFVHKDAREIFNEFFKSESSGFECHSRSSEQINPFAFMVHFMGSNLHNVQTSHNVNRHNNRRGGIWVQERYVDGNNHSTTYFI